MLLVTSKNLPKNRTMCLFHAPQTSKETHIAPPKTVKMVQVWNISESIDCNEEKPHFYDTTMKEYFKRDKRSKALAEIAVLLMVGVVPCACNVHVQCITVQWNPYIH